MTWRTEKKSRRDLGERGRRKATELLRALKIQRLDELDVDAIALHHGLRVRYGGLSGAQGRLASRAGRGLVRVSDRVQKVERQRYVVAHELGHHLMHAREGMLSLCTDGDFLRYDAGAGDTEEEANWFAAELLMPRWLFEPKCDTARPSIEHIRKLAREFTTTLTATAIRFVDLAPEACAVVWSEAGSIKWAIRGPTFWPSIQFGRRLSSFTHAHDAFDGDFEHTEPELVPASAWTSADHLEVYEDTRWFAAFQATLTLLWLPVEGDVS